MKRLLALDGGGLRGIFSLRILEKMEKDLREKTGNPKALLCEHFHYIGGTSTGAIIATALSWGLQVSEILDLYRTFGETMFRKRSLWGRLSAKFHHAELTKMLQRLFSEDGDGKKPVLLGTSRLRTKLLIVTKNSTTGSPWPLTNNPNAKYNQTGTPGNNLLLPLWQIIRASTAAPTFYPPERVIIHGDDGEFQGGTECLFEDGGVTPYNNPAHLLFLKATLPEYQTSWPTGRDKLHLVSIGTGMIKLSRKSRNDPMLLETATSLPVSLIQSYQQNQDLLCRAHGETLFGEAVDSEVGDLIRPNPKANFTYVRYNHLFTDDELPTRPIRIPSDLPMDSQKVMSFLEDYGGKYAQEYVKPEHLRLI